MFWVIMGHTLLWAFEYGLQNEYYTMTKVAPSVAFQVILQAPFSVDTFFFLSGFLVSLLMLQALDKRTFRLLYYYVHRYLRLTPVLGFWILVWWAIPRYISGGPLRGIMQQGTTCSYWWTNLLYIQNFYPTSFINECASWTWYLANDMQFYVLAPVLIFTFWYRRLIGAVLLILCVIGSIGANVIVSQQDKLSIDYIFVQSINYENHLYIKPYTRAVAYLVGIAAAYFVHLKPRMQFQPNVLHHILLYLISAGTMLWVIFVPYDLFKNFPNSLNTWSQAANTAFISFSRFSWTIGLAAITISFSYANGGGFAKDFLSASFWVPLARLTYSAYIIHPIWITIWSLLATRTYYFSWIGLMESTVWNVAVSYFFALLSYLFLEKPLMNLEVWCMSSISDARKT